MSSENGNGNSAPIHPWLVLATVMVGTLLIGLDRTVVNLAVPSIIGDFGVSVSTAAWVATGYIISNAVFVPVFGKLGDLFGNRIIYLWSFVGFIVISVLAGFAWNFTSLIVFRILQGLVGAAVYPTAMSLIAKSFTDKKARAQALGIWASSFAISAVIGPLIGGYLVDNFSWRWVFFINLPIGIAGLIMTLIFIAHDRPGEKGAFDWPGAVFLAGAISPLVLILDRGHDWGWASTAAWVCYVSAVVFGWLTYWWETRQSHPIIDFKFFRDPGIVSILFVSFVSFGGMMGAMFLLPVFTQTFLGYNATQSGLLFIPMGLALPIAAPLGGRLSVKFPMRYIVGFGMLLSAIGLFMLRNLDPGMTSWDFVLPLVTFGAGLGLGLAPLTNAMTTSVPQHEVGIASGLLNLVRNIGGAFGIAVFGTLLTTLTKANILTVAQHSVINSASPSAIAQGTGLIILKADLLSYGTIFIYSALAMLTGSLMAFLLLGNLKDHEELPPEVRAEAMAG